MTVEKFQTSNGLEVYVERVAGMRNIDAEVVVNVGSIDESDEVAGISHALEHSTFLKTPSFESKVQLRSFADEHAFYRNANTYYTRTKYITMGLDVDAMLHVLGEVTLQSQFGADAVKGEMNSIRREAKMGLDKIDTLHYSFMDYIQFGSTYGRRVLGYADRLDFSESQMIDFYNRFYKIGNMALVVVGDISVDEVARLAEKHFATQDKGLVEKRQLQPIANPVENNDGRYGLLRRESQNALVSIATKMPVELVERKQADFWAYGAAESLLTKEVFDLLRDELNLAYSASFSLNEYNHKVARALRMTASVNPDKVNQALDAFSIVMRKSSNDYSDKELKAMLTKQKQYAADMVDNVLDRATVYTDRIAYDEPVESVEELDAKVKMVEVGDVRRALEDILNVLNTERLFEFVTGPEIAVGNRTLINQSQFS